MKDFFEEFVEMLEQFTMGILDIAKKTFAVLLVLGYILLFLCSLIMTLIGWYAVGWQTSVKAFLILCLCLGILLHIGENK